MCWIINCQKGQVQVKESVLCMAKANLGERLLLRSFKLPLTEQYNKFLLLIEAISLFYNISFCFIVNPPRIHQRPLDSRTRMTKRFDKTPWKAFFYFFFTRKIGSPHKKNDLLLTFDALFLSLRNFCKTCSIMIMAIAFSHQIDTGSGVCTT